MALDFNYSAILYHYGVNKLLLTGTKRNNSSKQFSNTKANKYHLHKRYTHEQYNWPYHQLQHSIRDQKQKLLSSLHSKSPIGHQPQLAFNSTEVNVRTGHENRTSFHPVRSHWYLICHLFKLRSLCESLSIRFAQRLVFNDKRHVLIFNSVDEQPAIAY